LINSNKTRRRFDFLLSNGKYHFSLSLSLCGGREPNAAAMKFLLTFRLIMIRPFPVSPTHPPLPFSLFLNCDPSSHHAIETFPSPLPRNAPGGNDVYVIITQLWTLCMFHCRISRARITEKLFPRPNAKRLVKRGSNLEDASIYAPTIP